jgi:hypothetical protein
VPPLFLDVIGALSDLERLVLAQWYALPGFTRLLISLLVAACVVYGATKSERSGWSMLLMFSAFGLLAYIFALGVSGM